MSKSSPSSHVSWISQAPISCWRMWLMMYSSLEMSGGRSVSTLPLWSRGRRHSPQAFWVYIVVRTWFPLLFVFVMLWAPMSCVMLVGCVLSLVTLAAQKVRKSGDLGRVMSKWCDGVDGNEACHVSSGIDSCGVNGLGGWLCKSC